MANPLGRLFNLFRRPAQPPGHKPHGPPDMHYPQDAAQALRWFLGGTAPGWWASDHLEEARHFVGWNYVAVHACAKAMAQAEVHCYRMLAENEPGRAGPGGPEAGGDGLPAPDPALPRSLAAGRQNLRTKSATTPDGDRDARQTLPNHHPLPRLLRRPNPFQSADVFLYILGQQLRLTGSALVWLVLNELGTPCELWAVPTALAQPQPPSGAHPMGAYWVSSVGTTGYVSDTGWASSTPWAGGMLVDARFTRRIHWPHPVHLNDGVSPLAACALEVDIAEMLNKATWAGFQNRVRPGLSFKCANAGDYVPSEEELRRFEAKLRAERVGAENAGKHVIYPPGVEPVPETTNPAELDYINGRNQSRDNVFAAQHTPAVAAGVQDPGSYAQYYVNMMAWTEGSIGPDLALIGGQLTHFLSPYFGEDVCIELLARRFDDQQMLDSRIATDTTAKILTKNEARALRGLPPLPELEGSFCGDPTPAEKEAAAAAAPGLPGQEGDGPPRDMDDPFGDDDAEVGGDDDPEATPLEEPQKADAFRSGHGRPDLRGMPRAVAGLNGHGGARRG